ncbi:MAG: hypothetical protein KJO35_01100 [Gammaproteobacteria bacterium]|nr:hypothetical protein [Gammaproteobacteria bacterium]
MTLVDRIASCHGSLNRCYHLPERLMKHVCLSLFLTALLVSGSPSLADSQQKESAAQCQAVKKKIARLHSRMRAGYRTKTGTSLAKQLRKLQRKRAHACRRANKAL